MSIFFCNRGMSALQRQTVRTFGACLALIAFTEMVWLDFARHHPSTFIVALFAVVPAILVVAVIAAVGRYLARENDEFVRTLVIVSMLWSFGVIMVFDTILGVVLRDSPGLRILPMLNIDLFCAVTPVALRIQLGRSR
jgi:hypothetical protein